MAHPKVVCQPCLSLRRLKGQFTRYLHIHKAEQQNGTNIIRSSVGESGLGVREWCCIFDSGYTTPCGTCPLPKIAQSYMRDRFGRYSTSDEWFQSMQKQKSYNRYGNSSENAYLGVERNQDKIVKAKAALGLEDDMGRLGVAELKRAFKKAALRLHPDKQGGSEQAFLKLAKAYEYLLLIISKGQR